MAPPWPIPLLDVSPHCRGIIHFLQPLQLPLTTLLLFVSRFFAQRLYFVLDMQIVVRRLYFVLAMQIKMSLSTRCKTIQVNPELMGSRDISGDRWHRWQVTMDASVTHLDVM